MSEKSGLRIARSFADTFERITSSITAACVVAELLGTAIQEGGIANAAWAGVGFFFLSFVANAFKAILDTLIANAEEAKEQ